MKNRSVLITGSTSGIGLGIARAFAASGARVMLNGFGDPQEIASLCSELSSRHETEVRYHPADVSQGDEVAQLVAATEEAFGSLDVLINNAGIQFVSPIEDFPEDKWAAIQSVILTASYRAIKAALPGMKRHNRGRIINIASAHGLAASPFKSAYVAAKHGQIGLTKTVALELAETGITCNAICPGYVLTPLVERQIEGHIQRTGKTREQVIREIILVPQPSKRFVTIEEIAGLAVYLAGDLAASITGSAIAIDGGWTAH